MRDTGFEITDALFFVRCFVQSKTQGDPSSSGGGNRGRRLSRHSVVTAVRKKFKFSDRDDFKDFLTYFVVSSL